MVRSIIGTMLDIEIKNESISTFETILKSKNRNLARTTAPRKCFIFRQGLL